MLWIYGLILEAYSIGLLCHRFVRFVNQPEVLERFVTLEKEIVQIEGSIQSNELANSNGVVQQAEGNYFILY